MKTSRVADLSCPSNWANTWVHCLLARHTILGILCCVLTSSFAAAQASAKNVLVLFSAAGQITDLPLIERSAREHFSGQVNFYVNYVYGNYEQMAEGPPYLESLAETIRRGYQHVKPDVIVVAAPDALQFTTQYRNKIFPGVPIVFYGLSKNELAGIKLLPGMVGRTESSDIQATINLALRLHPDARAVAVVEESEGLWWSIAHAELLRHQGQVKEIDLIGPASAEEIRRIDALPPHTLILFQQFPETAVRRSVGTYDVLAEASKRLPTYSAFHTLCLDYGCIGGVYADWNQNMAWGGETAARILSGETLGSVPVVEDSLRQVMVDWRQLRHWHIPESALPPGSLVLYRQPTPWQLYRNYILAAVALIVLQAILIFALLWQRARKRKAEAVLRESEKQLRELSGRLIVAQEEERSRIARELHDDICQRLAVMSVDLDQANRSSNGSRCNLGEIKKQCFEIANDLQTLSHQLHSSNLEYLGLVAAMRGFCVDFSKKHEVRIDFRESGVPKHLPQDISLVLFRIAQESLHNAVKYSQTAEFAVELSGAADEVRLEVKDWGAGFDVGEARRNSGLGLLSMQERVRLVRGRLSVESKPGRGTKIIAVVPVAAGHGFSVGRGDDQVASMTG